jgi:hypothetical protein
LLRRHDFTIDIVGQTVESQLHAADYREVDGIVIPATRRAYAPMGDDQITFVAIDMADIAIH